MKRHPFENVRLLFIQLVSFGYLLRRHISDVFQAYLSFYDFSNQVFVLFEKLVMKQVQSRFITQSLLRSFFQEFFQEVLHCRTYLLFLKVYAFIFYLHHVLWSDSFEGVGADQKLIKQQSQTVKIDGLVIPFLFEHFRGDVLIAPTQTIEFLVLPDFAGKSKITYPNPFVLIYQNVFRFEISIDESFIVDTGNSEGNLYPNGVFLSQSHFGVFFHFFVAFDETEKISEGAEVQYEINVFGILELVVELYLVFGGVLKDLELVFYHLQTSFLSAFSFIYPFHAEKMAIVLPFNEVDLGVRTLSDLIQDVEVLGGYRLALVVYHPVLVVTDYLQRKGQFHQSFELQGFIKTYLVLTVKKFFFFAQEEVQIVISGVGGDERCSDEVFRYESLPDEFLKDISSSQRFRKGCTEKYRPFNQ